MSIEENKALIFQIFDLLNKRELDAYYALFAPDYIARFPTANFSLEQTRHLDAGLFSAFPDYSVTLDDVVAEGDKVAFRSTFTGTHTVEWMGVAPTGKKMSFALFYISRIVDGKVAEDWGLNDLPLVMQQIGVVPPMGQK
jgi:predicted ester cyclase